MMKPNIFILSQPVQSGKTTLLQTWLKGKKNIGGILTPDENGYRKLLNIATGEQYNLQLKDHEHGISIGRFVFDESVFQVANEILLGELSANHEWIVVDEIGKLEFVQNKGLEPAVSKLIQHFKENTAQSKLLLVIRDYLLDEVIQHYQLEDAKVLLASFFLNTTVKNISGAVLCGGESTRMKTDKAFIQYHGKPQYEHVSDLLYSFCNNVFISVNEKQNGLIEDSYQKVIDRNEFNDAGPLTGLLSVIKQCKDESILLVGCDYPYLKRSDLIDLFNNRSIGFDVVCFMNEEEFAEPLIAIYESSCFDLLFDFYAKGGRSLQQFLRQVNTKFIKPKTKESLMSFDTQDKMAAFKNG